MAQSQPAKKEPLTPNQDEDESEFSRFEALARKLVAVPKAEIDKLRKQKD